MVKAASMGRGGARGSVRHSDTWDCGEGEEDSMYCEGYADILILACYVIVVLLAVGLFVCFLAFALDCCGTSKKNKNIESNNTTSNSSPLKMYNNRTRFHYHYNP